jgi:hypothetical protein
VHHNGDNIHGVRRAGVKNGGSGGWTCKQVGNERERMDSSMKYHGMAKKQASMAMADIRAA